MESNNFDISKNIEKYMDSYADSWCFSGNVIVSKDGEVLYKKAYGMANIGLDVPNNIDTKFNIASLTKAFTAMAVLILHEKKLLNIKDSISKYLPDYPEFDSRITIQHLLTHTSGIINQNNLNGFFTKIKKLNYTEKEFIALFKDYPLEFEPGEKFSYCNSGYYLLGVIIQRVSGESYGDFIKNNILDVAKMNNSGLYDEKEILYNRAYGYELNGDKLINDSFTEWSKLAPSGGMYSTIHDMIKWDNILYTNTLVSNESLEEMFTEFKDGYGYGWFIDEYLGRKRVGHNGAHNGYITQYYRYPEEGVSIILLCNHRFINVWDICDNIADIIFNNNINLPSRPKVFEIDYDLYLNYVGNYEDPDDDEDFIVTSENNKLYLQFGSDSRFEIYPISETKFNHVLIDEQYEFVDNGIKIFGTVYPKRKNN